MSVPKQDDLRQPDLRQPHQYADPALSEGHYATGNQPTLTDRKQQLIDVSNLRFYGRLFEEYKWSTDVLNWGVFVQTLNEIASRIENAPDVVRAKLAQPEEPLCIICGITQKMHEHDPENHGHEFSITPLPTPARVEQAELPPLKVQCGVCGDTGKWNGSTCHFCACYYIQGREHQLRAALQMERSYLKSWQDEITTHKATKEELEAVIQKNRGLAEITKELDALVDKACDAGEKTEAENQELRQQNKRLEEIPLLEEILDARNKMIDELRQKVEER